MLEDVCGDERPAAIARGAGWRHFATEIVDRPPTQAFVDRERLCLTHASSEQGRAHGDCRIDTVRCDEARDESGFYEIEGLGDFFNRNVSVMRIKRIAG
ncbi:hypothetical protein [Burkholderia sp. AU16741]|uniref:hypothetical protein n=1 Tax=Burkholderia sp. AU16741 TaxID=2015347 RepID=UPI0015C59BF7|nr:hypothetical protein [Burkholderia sp. AU16741]